MTLDSRCECGEPIPADAPEGLCPRCLLARGLAPSSCTTVEVDVGVTGAGSSDEFLSPQISDRYRVIGEAARGGMGRVLLVHDAQLGRNVALKELLPERAARRGESGETGSIASRFVREARITGQLEHPSVTPVHELGRRADGTLFYTMKFVHGRTLSQAIRGAQSTEARLRLLPHFVDLCHAIAYAHARGVIHRDVKPGNVMLGEYGETIVVDWGLAKVKGQEDVHAADLSRSDRTDTRAEGAGSSETAYGEALGTPAYMPPEQAMGRLQEIDERSDIYSLGAVLYEILTGHRPYSGTTPEEVVRKVIDGAPRPVRALDRDVPPEYGAICARAMARDPRDRYATAKEMAESVARVSLTAPRSRTRRVIERLALMVAIGAPLAVLTANWWSQESLRGEYERIRAKGIALEAGGSPLSFAEGDSGMAEESRVAGNRLEPDGLGELYALGWRFPKLAGNGFEWQVPGSLVCAPGAAWPLPETEDASSSRVVEENRAVLESARAIAASPPGDVRAILRVAARGRSPISAEFPRLAAVRAATTLLALEAYVAYRDGRAGDGLASVAQMLDIAGHLSDLPFLITYLLRLAVIQDAAVTFVNLQAHSKLPVEGLQAVERRLGQLDLREDFVAALGGEMSSVVWIFETMKRASPSEFSNLVGGALAVESPYSPAMLGWSVYSSRAMRFWLNSEQIIYMRSMTDHIEAARRPHYEGRAEHQRIDAATDRLGGWCYPVVGSAMIKVEQASARSAEVERHVVIARLRAALARFRVTRGSYPASLEELTPEFLGEIPRDPSSGEAISYHLSPGGFALADVQSTGASKTPASVEPR